MRVFVLADKKFIIFSECRTAISIDNIARFYAHEYEGFKSVLETVGGFHLNVKDEFEDILECLSRANDFTLPPMEDSVDHQMTPSCEGH